MSFLQSHMWYEEYMLSVDMLCLNVESLMFGLQNLCSSFRCLWFLGLRYPRLLTSKAVTEVLATVISLTKCAYLFDFTVFRVSIFSSRGQVNSKILNFSLLLSQMVMSGLSAVIVSSGGTVPPPPGASCPGMSLCMVNLLVSRLCTI